MTDFQYLTLEKQDGLATLRLNRPADAHSINVELARELMLAAIDCDEDPDVRAVLLTSSGKIFCAGGDVPSFHAAGDQAPALLKEITTYLHAASSRFARMRSPLIVAVNGTAAGAGFSLAIAGDLVIAAESAKFTMAYTGLGVSPDGGSSAILPRLVGLRRAQELMFTNRLLSATEAQEWGLVTSVVADDALEEEALKLAKRMAAGPTLAYGQIKALLLTSNDTALESQLELESRGIASCIGSADGQEGVAAFIEKRKPSFSGQ
ncbi:enoyl-CoA hydratase/isomerase family protein [Spongiibacter nanhainus]|uniref:Enoyl-CoA hydratase/isomerase family protein n=1 Tax=Spongiibacter nanhainus TaxID=2794344 RepID=A0A7T4UQY3_9GAMM|nr:enoyl-CoA hydratase-related protein [Spongiibacter nanhainus]QQD19233.1 enoyl-CoA hydratase/isomerase family protein [Spongiibacter nanhainus]